MYNQRVKKAKRISKAEKVALTSVHILDEEGLMATGQGIVGILKGMAGEYAFYAHLSIYGYYSTTSKRRLTVMVNGLVKKGLLSEKEVEGENFLELTQTGEKEILEFLPPRKMSSAPRQIRRKGD